MALHGRVQAGRQSSCLFLALAQRHVASEGIGVKKERKNYARGRELRKKHSLQASLPYNGVKGHYQAALTSSQAVWALR